MLVDPSQPAASPAQLLYISGGQAVGDVTQGQYSFYGIVRFY